MVAPGTAPLAQLAAVPTLRTLNIARCEMADGDLRHLLAEARLDAGRLAGEEGLGVGDQLGIVRLADPPNAGRRAAPDLEQQARP